MHTDTDAASGRLYGGWEQGVWMSWAVAVYFAGAAVMSCVVAAALSRAVDEPRIHIAVRGLIVGLGWPMTMPVFAVAWHRHRGQLSVPADTLKLLPKTFPSNHGRSDDGSLGTLQHVRRNHPSHREGHVGRRSVPAALLEASPRRDARRAGEAEVARREG